jgi:RNA polymerase sigma factor (sigma-70 family)
MNIEMLETTSGTESIAVSQVLAAARGESDAGDREGLRTLLQRATGRGYVLASELHELYDPLNDAGDWEAAVSIAARDGGLAVIEDGAGDAPPPPIALSLTTDSARQYLNGIGRVELLTAEEEVDLAKRDQAGLYASSVLRSGIELTPMQRAKLRRVVLDGQRAHERMIESNLRLVVSVAKRFLGRGLSLLELIQEGNLGLIRGVEKFDHTRGYKFSTYATWWIRQALTRGTANKARTVRLPVHVHEMVAKIRRAELELLQTTGLEPTDAIVGELLGIPEQRVRDLKHASRPISSLDAPVGEDGNATVGDLVADRDATDPVDTVGELMVRHEIKAALSELEDRERDILMMRYGLLDGTCHTLEDIGARHGLTRERIRQIEKQTLAKLRHPSFAARLDGLSDNVMPLAPHGKRW